MDVKQSVTRLAASPSEESPAQLGAQFGNQLATHSLKNVVHDLPCFSAIAVVGKSLVPMMAYCSPAPKTRIARMSYKPSDRSPLTNSASNVRAARSSRNGVLTSPNDRRPQSRRALPAATIVPHRFADFIISKAAELNTACPTTERGRVGWRQQRPETNVLSFEKQRRTLLRKTDFGARRA